MNFSFRRKLKEFRKRAGLSLMQVARASGIAKSSLSEYEHGRNLPPLPRLLILIKIYSLDPFDIEELLSLQLIEADLLKAFRRVCKEEATNPLQALRDFLLIYCKDVETEPK